MDGWLGDSPGWVCKSAKRVLRIWLSARSARANHKNIKS